MEIAKQLEAALQREADLLKQVVILQNAVEFAKDTTDRGEVAAVMDKALADCKNVRGFILCRAEEAARYIGKDHEYGYDLVTLDDDIPEGTKLHIAIA